VIEAAERLRDLAGDEIMSGRLRAADKPTPI
jgi:hypothetical protein